LGTFVRRFGEAGDLASMERFGGALMRELTAGRGSRHKVDVLIGLSNSGYAGALPLVRQYLADDDVSVRAAALQALRLMQHDDIAGLLIKGLHDAESDVRLGALEAIRNRAYSAALAHAVTQAMQRDADVQVRIGAVRLLGTWLRDAPGLRDAIETATRDEEASMRQVATSLLKAS
jgi:HEAT repeat protein